MEYPYGPFHRLESPTQTPDDARRQQAMGEIWGRTPYASAWPQVRAYRGALPADTRGIEFYTGVPPDNAWNRSHVAWSARGRRDPAEVRIEDDFAKIACRIVKDTQT